MDKLVKFLEQYVQWITLALAGVWVSWQAYSYIVQEPLTTTVGAPPATEVVTPGTVDPKINDGSVHKLKLAIADPKIEPPKLAKVSELVERGVNEADVKPVEVAGLSSGSFYAPYGGDDTRPKNQVFVDKIPNLPAAIPEAGKITARWTVIDVPAAVQPAGPAAAPAADGAAAPAAAPAMVRTDVAYYSGYFTVDSGTLTKEFTRCYSKSGVPLNLLLSEFVKVELLREEKLPNGTWSGAVVIPTLPIYTIMPDPREQKPPLAAAALKQALYDYKAWFEQNQGLIINPAFYLTAENAEPWLAPGVTPPEAGGQGGAGAMTPDARQAYENNIRAQRAAAAAAAAARRGTTIRPGPGYTPPPGYRRPGGPPVPPQYHGEPLVPPIMPDGRPATPPPLINPAGQPPAMNNGLPGQDVRILVHDISIQEGKTYRYAVRYKLFNPMWDHADLAIPTVAAKFDMDSPDASNPASIKEAKDSGAIDPKLDAAKLEKLLWTADVTVEQRAHIFVTNSNANTSQAEFLVYTWKNGRWTETTVKRMMPGDPIMVDKTPTPWTVVDIRKDAHAPTSYVILMDDHGILTRRDKESDAQSQLLQKLKNEAATPAAAMAR